MCSLRIIDRRLNIDNGEEGFMHRNTYYVDKDTFEESYEKLLVFMDNVSFTSTSLTILIP